MIFVELLIELRMKDGEVSQYPGPDRRVVFYDSARENKRVDRRERSRHSKNRASQSIAEDLNRQSGSWVPFIGRGNDRTHILTDAGNPEQAAFSRQYFVRNIP